MKGNPDADTDVQDVSINSEHERLADLVRSFITMMNVGNMARLDVKYHDLRISLRSHSESTTSTSTVIRMSPNTEVAADVFDSIVDQPSSHVVAAPMIGTFYTSPAPNEPPFVMPGDHVEEGQTIGIIEAMKIMNEIASDLEGTVLEILAKNGQPVEFGSALVRIDPETP